jgi:hypothetical protein
MEGDFCQRGSSVTKTFIKQLGGGGFFALLLMLAFLVCLGAIAALAMNMYKRKMLLFKVDFLSSCLKIWLTKLAHCRRTKLPTAPFHSVAT